jgi:spoIIIJ-associated protein
VTGTLRVEATGETVGEAKWKALRELELLAPSLDKAGVVFEVLADGDRGLLGVGSVPARVAAALAGPPATTASPSTPARASDEAERLRRLLERVTATLGLRCRIEVVETEAVLTGTCVGDDLGRLIGRRGQTLDALQLLAGAILQRGGEGHRQVVVDAAGYRARRRRALEVLALRAAREVLASGNRVELEPMSASERKLVHSTLEHHAGVATASEGVEPYRRVVLEPA